MLNLKKQLIKLLQVKSYLDHKQLTLNRAVVSPSLYLNSFKYL